MTLSPYSVHSPRPATFVLGCFFLPALLAAQDGAVVEMVNSTHATARAGPVTADHSDHAYLHRPGPEDAGVPLTAAETIGLDDDAPALCRAAELALTAGLLTPPERGDERLAWYRRAEAYAVRARALRPDHPEALHMEAAAVGLQASHLPRGERIDAAERVLALSDRILARRPEHPGALHLQARLNAEAMRMNGMVRFLVGRVMGADALRDASWERAEDGFRRALAAEPENPVHRYELALVLRDTDRHREARGQLRRLLAYPDRDLLMSYYKDRARAALRTLD